MPRLERLVDMTPKDATDMRVTVDDVEQRVRFSIVMVFIQAPPTPIGWWCMQIRVWRSLVARASSKQLQLVGCEPAHLLTRDDRIEHHEAPVAAIHHAGRGDAVGLRCSRIACGTSRLPGRQNTGTWKLERMSAISA